MSEELLTGKEGIEASQGYVEMPPAVPESASVPDDISLDTTVEERAAAEVAITPRAYVDTRDGSPRPDNETVELDRAVKDIGERRAEEFKLLEQLKDQQLRDRLEGLKSQLGAEVNKANAGEWTRTAEDIDALPIAQQIAELEALRAQQQAQQQTQPQPGEQPQPVDQDLTKLLQDNPRLIEAINNQRVQDWQGAHQTIAAAERWIQDSALQATAGVFVAWPELQNISAQELPVALNLMQRQNPERHAQVMRHIAGIQGMLEQSRYVQQQQQQRAQQQYQQQWNQFSAEEDSKFVSRNPEMADAQTAAAVTHKAVDYLKQIGFSDDDLSRSWGGAASWSPRDARVQQVIMDALKYRQAVAAVPQARRNAPARVMKPGASGQIASQEGPP
jgi:hypothetical protein